MSFIRWTGLFIAALALVGVTAAQEVHTDYDHKVQFERYHTYSWGKVKTSNPLWESQIQEAVDNELSKHGWQKGTSGGDVVLMAVGSAQNQQEYQTFYDGMGAWYWRGFGDVATTTVELYRVGTLIVDMYDTSNKHQIWRGTAQDTLVRQAGT